MYFSKKCSDESYLFKNGEVPTNVSYLKSRF